MEVDLVDPATGGIMGPESGWVAVGVEPPGNGAGGADVAPVAAEQRRWMAPPSTSTWAARIGSAW